MVSVGRVLHLDQPSLQPPLPAKVQVQLLRGHMEPQILITAINFGVIATVSHVSVMMATAALLVVGALMNVGTESVVVVIPRALLLVRSLQVLLVIRRGAGMDVLLSRLFIFLHFHALHAKLAMFLMLELVSVLSATLVLGLLLQVLL